MSFIYCGCTDLLQFLVKSFPFYSHKHIFQFKMYNHFGKMCKHFFFIKHTCRILFYSLICLSLASILSLFKTASQRQLGVCILVVIYSGSVKNPLKNPLRLLCPIHRSFDTQSHACVKRKAQALSIVVIFLKKSIQVYTVCYILLSHSMGYIDVFLCFFLCSVVQKLVDFYFLSKRKKYDRPTCESCIGMNLLYY